MGNIVNAKLLATVANSIDIGCDILHFGNRQLEKQLGAENMSNDTVYVTEADGGAEFNDLSCSSVINSCGVSRAAVPLKVNNKGCIYSLTQQQRDLMIKDSEFADKIMARFIDGRNAETYGVIAGGCTAMAVDKDSTDSIIKSDSLVGAYFDALAGIEASKLKGNVVGVGNALTINAMAKALAQGTGIGVKNYGKELWKRGLADFAGINWSKSGVLGTVSASALPSAMTAYTVANDAEGSGFSVITDVVLTVASGTWAAGAAVTPFTIAGVNLCDALGNDTGIPATFEGKVNTAVTSGTSISVKLDRPIHYQSLDPIKNVESGSVFGTSSASGLSVGAASVLTSGKTYYKPVVMFKEDDFFVAVKGLEAMKAQDSATVPTGFTEKGILPIRGTAWSNPETSTTYVRFDAMFGSMMKRGIAGRKIYLEA